MDRIKRISKELMNEYSERFGTDFSTNKQSLNEISIVRSKGLKNKIAGYITKILQRQAKFEERKQMIIDNEKKSQERKQSRSKKPEGMPANCPSFDLFSRSRNVSSNTSEAGKSPKFGFF